MSNYYVSSTMQSTFSHTDSVKNCHSPAKEGPSPLKIQAPWGLSGLALSHRVGLRDHSASKPYWYVAPSSPCDMWHTPAKAPWRNWRPPNCQTPDVPLRCCCGQKRHLTRKPGEIPWATGKVLGGVRWSWTIDLSLRSSFAPSELDFDLSVQISNSMEFLLLHMSQGSREARWK